MGYSPWGHKRVGYNLANNNKRSSYQERKMDPFASALIITVFSILVVGVGPESYKLFVIEQHTSEN